MKYWWPDNDTYLTLQDHNYRVGSSTRREKTEKRFCYNLEKKKVCHSWNIITTSWRLFYLCKQSSRWGTWGVTPLVGVIFDCWLVPIMILICGVYKFYIPCVDEMKLGRRHQYEVYLCKTQCSFSSDFYITELCALELCVKALEYYEAQSVT